MLLTAILAVAAANAQSGNFGAGVTVGDPTGVSLGWRPSEWNAVQAGVGWDVLDSRLKGSADYLQSVAVIDPNRQIRVPIYIGLGAGVGRNLGGQQEPGGRAPAQAEIPGEGGADGATPDLSARVPIGASVLFMETPVEVFGTVIPSLRVYPDRQVDVDGAFGVRYYF